MYIGAYKIERGFPKAFVVALCIHRVTCLFNDNNLSNNKISIKNLI